MRRDYFGPGEWIMCLIFALMFTPAAILLDVGDITVSGTAYWLWRVLGGGVLTLISVFLWWCVWSERDLVR